MNHADHISFRPAADARCAFLPTFVLAGFIFPIENMPYVIQLLTSLIPLRCFLDSSRPLKNDGLNGKWKMANGKRRLNTGLFHLPFAIYHSRMRFSASC